MKGTVHTDQFADRDGGTCCMGGVGVAVAKLIMHQHNFDIDLS